MLRRMLRPGSPLLVGGVIFALLVLAGSVVLTAMLIVNWQQPLPLETPPQPSEQPAFLPSATLTASPLAGVTPLSVAATATLTPTPTLAPPSATPTPLVYVVVQGDTLSDIAYRFGVTIEALKQANGLSGDMIYIGQKLLIPSGERAFVGTPVSPTAAIPTGEGTLVPPVSPTPGGAAPVAVHLVQSGETLDSIAARYGLSAQDLRFANFMAGDALLPGQMLNIPAAPLTTSPPFSFSILEGDLSAAYPLSIETERFTLHFQPQSFVSVDPPATARLVSNGLAHLELLFQTSLAGHFDVYAAGSVFAPPDRALRGRSFSLRRYYFFLHDGSGNAADQQYIAAHELTHLFTWNVFGAPVSAMLSEGAAVYAGMRLVASSAHLPLDTFCAAYLQVGKLPRVSASLSFGGHNLDLENYYAAGCFVGYLLESYGPAKFGQLYSSGNYAGIYGKSLAALEQDWRAALSNTSLPPELDAAALVTTVEDVEAAYLRFFSAFGGTPQQLLAYRELDLARLALLEGRLAEAEAYLEKHRQTLQAP